MVACSQMHVCGRKLERTCLERTHTAMCDHVTTAGKHVILTCLHKNWASDHQISSMKNPSQGVHSHFCLCKHTFACRITVNKGAFLWLCVSALGVTNPFPPFLLGSSPDPSISLIPSSAAHFSTEGMVAVASIIHSPSEQVVLALQGAAGENREAAEERLKTRRNEEWIQNGWRL